MNAIKILNECVSSDLWELNTHQQMDQTTTVHKLCMYVKTWWPETKHIGNHNGSQCAKCYVKICTKTK